ncbi:FMN-dependent oxidoreductase (nitrilotriacetate monooxygenase family) [Ancylobacter sp. 3268]|uniref:LLM class flavin-dependent oxidoreductase n=1 Tax=Ancylobacter sp. 3268 TaxID=2817752 RepID=UPI00285CAF12|nr:LLM class flavin-dependent oxidoreductase [Ancylobacter sp. 3268]MDR6953395.1 FMN-dependent oxidoreductase (nitrilotriacetate monooxygenase family) [Ancylobacter sp. 3268]
MTHRRLLHLNINILHAGFYASAWRSPEADPHATFDIGHYVRCAEIAERGTFDAVFLADRPALEDKPDLRPFLSLEPTVVLTAIAAATSHIGLIATASTSYNEPYNIARRFATLDLVSGGRAGFNVVTTADPNAAANFGQSLPEHGARYARAKEFTEVVSALWDSWEDDAFVGDKAGARFLDPAKIHRIDHKGRFFEVAGPLNLPRSPQGRPILVQAGGSGDGRDLAARHADVVFSVGEDIPRARAYADDLRARAAAHGRDPRSIVVLPGLATVIGSTEEEARRRQEELGALIPLDYAIARLGVTFGQDLSHLELDAPVPDLPIPVNGSTTFAQATLNFARQGNLTFRQLLYKLGGGIGHRVIVGTPEAIADDIEEWFTAGAADGFNLMPDVLPTGLEAFVDHVVPILRRRGLFRTHYAETTLRERFGLPRPANRYAASAQAEERQRVSA